MLGSGNRARGVTAGASTWLVPSDRRSPQSGPQHPCPSPGPCVPVPRFPVARANLLKNPAPFQRRLSPPIHGGAHPHTRGVARGDLRLHTRVTNLLIRRLLWSLSPPSSRWNRLRRRFKGTLHAKGVQPWNLMGCLARLVKAPSRRLLGFGFLAGAISTNLSTGR